MPRGKNSAEASLYLLRPIDSGPADGLGVTPVASPSHAPLASSHAAWPLMPAIQPLPPCIVAGWPPAESATEVPVPSSSFQRPAGLGAVGPAAAWPPTK